MSMRRKLRDTTNRNSVACYESSLKGVNKEDFEREVDKWIDEGALMPWVKEVEVGVLPLMAVLQPMKSKARPVFDFCEVNSHVECHTGEVVDVCGETLKKWRRMTEASKMVDLKSVYLQLTVSKNVWKHQLVRYKRRTYCLTRLGFGLNSAPKIMSTRKILEMLKVDGAVSLYIDDIIVNETELAVEEVVAHLRKFGLIVKLPESMDGGAALGLRLKRDETVRLQFWRGDEIPQVKKNCVGGSYSPCAGN